MCICESLAYHIDHPFKIEEISLTLHQTACCLTEHVHWRGKGRRGGREGGREEEREGGREGGRGGGGDRGEGGRERGKDHYIAWRCTT